MKNTEVLQNTHKCTVLPSPSAQSGDRISGKEVEVRDSGSRHHQLCCSHRVPTLPMPHGPLSPGMAATPGFKSQCQSSSAAPFPTPPTISYTCQHSPILPALLGCHSKSGQVWPHGVEPIFSKLSRRPCNQGELPPSYVLGGSHFHHPSSKHGHSYLTYL